MIRVAHFAEDREDVIRLWSSCFGDERQYIEFFLDNVPSENVLFVYKKEDNVVGMFYLMPALLNYINNDTIMEKRVFYLYALGVLEEYRKHGIAGKMLDFAKAYADERAAEIYLVPANDALVGYYVKHGFTLIRREEKELKAAEYNRCAIFWERANSDFAYLERKYAGAVMDSMGIDIMVTTMNYGRDFIRAVQKAGEVRLDSCFN